MKKCDQEGCDNEAVVHLTKVVPEGMKKEHLCQECAGKLGVDTDQPADMTEFLAQVGPAQTGGSLVALMTCPGCGMDRSRLKKKMRLGCQTCYSTFSEDLAPIIQSMHHSDQHVGKVPGSQGRRAQITRGLAILHEELGTAVLQEQFENAATLRDKIKALREELDDE